MTTPTKRRGYVIVYTDTSGRLKRTSEIYGPDDKARAGRDRTRFAASSRSPIGIWHGKGYNFEVMTLVGAEKLGIKT